MPTKSFVWVSALLVATVVVGAAGAEPLLERHVRIWDDPAARGRAVEATHALNPEWDLMARTFFVLALANDALAHPERQKARLTTLDTVLADTLAAERRGGLHHFLMPYSRRGSFEQRPARSLFTDGEIALMLAARQLVAPKERWGVELKRRVDLLVARLEASPLLSAESYPNECWMFCNSLALAAIRLSDAVDGRDHGSLRSRWVEKARAQLLDAETGMLVSSFGWRGERRDGPEGSSIWLVTHALQLVDPALARQQYELAREHLAGSVGPMGFSREWPTETRNPTHDVDAGMVTPQLGASTSASGLAMIAAQAFDDESFAAALERSFTLVRLGTGGAEPDATTGGLVGEAVVVYSRTLAGGLGPLWRKALAPR